MSGMAETECRSVCCQGDGPHLTPCYGVGLISTADWFESSLCPWGCSGGSWVNAPGWLWSSRNFLSGLWEMESELAEEKVDTASEDFPSQNNTYLGQ